MAALGLAAVFSSLSFTAEFFSAAARLSAADFLALAIFLALASSFIVFFKTSPAFTTSLSDSSLTFSAVSRAC